MFNRIIIELLFLLFLVTGINESAEAKLTLIGNATYAGNSYNLIYDDNPSGAIVWLDYTNPRDIWFNQVAWANSINNPGVLSYNFLPGYNMNWGGSVWQLPTTIDNLSSAGGPGVPPPANSSQMVYLWYTQLGNTASESGFAFANAGPFTHLQGDYYWSGTAHPALASSNWVFDTYDGSQFVQNDSSIPRPLGIASRLGQLLVGVDNIIGDYKYARTVNAYAPSNWTAGVLQEFGPTAEVVDWNDIKNTFGGSIADLKAFFDTIGITSRMQSCGNAVTWNGAQYWAGTTRSYGIDRMEGSVPDSYLVHDQVQNNWAVIGSWPADRCVVTRIPLVPQPHTLTLTGTGNGSVNSDPSGLIACTWSPQTGTCSTNQPATTSLTLTASRGDGYIFNGWGGACSSCSGLSCLVAFDADKTCTVNFSQLLPVRIARATSLYYSTINNAHSNANSGDTIQAWGTGFTENLTISKNIFFDGGYNDDFTAENSYTTLYGILTIKNGSLTAKKLVVSATTIPPPPAPDGVSASAGNGQATISWNAVPGATSYNLYYSTSQGVTKQNGIKISGVTSQYIKTSLTNGTPYYFVVTAVNTNGESAVSSEVSATPVAPSQPSITGRWDSANSITHAGVIGALLTQTGSNVTGTVKGISITGSFNNGVFTGVMPVGIWQADVPGPYNFVLTLSADGQTLSGPVTFGSFGTLNCTFTRMSNNPINPDTTPPKVISWSPSPGQTGVPRQNYVYTITWSKPVNGWNLALSGKLGGVDQGIYVYDSNTIYYTPQTNTFNFPQNSGLILDPQSTYFMGIQAGSSGDWFDPYGVPADQPGSTTFTTGN